MGNPISQAEARRYRKRASELELILDGQRNGWLQSFPGGTHIGSTSAASDSTVSAIRTARRLNHAVVVVQNGSELMFYALPHPKDNSNG